MIRIGDRGCRSRCCYQIGRCTGECRKYHRTSNGCRIKDILTETSKQQTSHDNGEYRSDNERIRCDRDRAHQGQDDRSDPPERMSQKRFQRLLRRFSENSFTDKCRDQRTCQQQDGLKRITHPVGCSVINACTGKNDKKTDGQVAHDALCRLFPFNVRAYVKIKLHF